MNALHALSAHASCSRPPAPDARHREKDGGLLGAGQPAAGLRGVCAQGGLRHVQHAGAGGSVQGGLPAA
jgi:hypothetical protein